MEEAAAESCAAVEREWRERGKKMIGGKEGVKKRIERESRNK